MASMDCAYEQQPFQAMTATVPVIAIDGPSGAGKGTVCLMVARRLGFHILDSGAVYRAIACWAMHEGLNEQQALAAISAKSEREPLELTMRGDGRDGHVAVLVNQQDVTGQLRSEECGTMASKLAKYPVVREKVLGLQRACAKWPGLVADGRDMASVVFPQAQLKIFLTADVKVRAERRFRQLQSAGLNVSLRKVLDDMRWRDEQDRARKVAPLVPDPAAVIVDTTKLSIDEAVSQVLALADQAGMSVDK